MTWYLSGLPAPAYRYLLRRARKTSPEAEGVRREAPVCRYPASVFRPVQAFFCVNKLTGIAPESAGGNRSLELVSNRGHDRIAEGSRRAGCTYSERLTRHAVSRNCRSTEQRNCPTAARLLGGTR